MIIKLFTILALASSLMSAPLMEAKKDQKTSQRSMMSFYYRTFYPDYKFFKDDYSPKYEGFNYYNSYNYDYKPYTYGLNYEYVPFAYEYFPYIYDRKPYINNYYKHY
jgi:hypothetical protein